MTWSRDRDDFETIFEGPSETFETGMLHPDYATRMTENAAERGAHWNAILETASKSGGARLRTLCARILLRFAFYVLDLPASEYHHRKAYGLLDHSLEVADLASRETHLLDPGLFPADDPQKTWTFYAILLGLFHDLGKATDLVVSDPCSGKTWNPVLEPVALFYRRHLLDGFETARVTFVPHRGLYGHRGRALLLLPRILQAPGIRHLTHNFLLAADLICGPGDVAHYIPLHAETVAAIVRRCDGTSAKASHLQMVAADAEAQP